MACIWLWTSCLSICVCAPGLRHVCVAGVHPHLPLQSGCSRAGTRVPAGWQHPGVGEPTCSGMRSTLPSISLAFCPAKRQSATVCLQYCCLPAFTATDLRDGLLFLVLMQHPQDWARSVCSNIAASACPPVALCLHQHAHVNISCHHTGLKQQPSDQLVPTLTHAAVPAVSQAFSLQFSS